MPTLDQIRSSVRTKIVGFLFFLGVLADIFGVTDRLDALLPVVPALIPLIALLGTLAFGVILAERIGWWLYDIRRRGPERRAFMRLHPVIVQCKKSLLALPDMSDERTRTAQRDALASEADTQVETLAHDLNILGIPTLPTITFPFIRLYFWTEFLARLEVYARDGRLEAATELGNRVRSDSEAHFGSS